MAKANDEPSMEEILSSIRKIIADEEEPDTTADSEPVDAASDEPEAAAHAPGEAEADPFDVMPAEGPEPSPGVDEADSEEAAVANDEEVLDLTLEDEFLEVVAAETEPAPEPEPEPELEVEEDWAAVAKEAAEPEPEFDDIDAFAADAPPEATMAEGKEALSQMAEQLIGESASAQAASALQRLNHAMLPGQSFAGADKSIEVFLADQLREPLRVWLDANLAGLVERIVEREIKKLVRNSDSDSDQAAF